MANSSTGSTSIQPEIAGFTRDQVDLRVTYAATVLLIYDYILTLSAEQRHIWKSGRSLVFYLFIGVRYGTLISLICNGLTDILPLATDRECAAFALLYNVLNLIGSLSLSGIFMLRAYAVWNRRLPVLLGLGLIVVGKGVLNVLGDTFSGAVVTEGAVRQYEACSVVARNTTFQDIVSASNTCVITFDSLVLILTAAKTMQQVLNCRRLGIQQSLSYHILRDGLLYFIAIEAWVISLIVLINEFPDLVWADVATRFEQVVAAILTQRLLLNLRQVQNEHDSPTHISANIGELNFAHGSIIGNIGAPLRAMDDEDVDNNTQEAPHVGEDGGGENIELDEMALVEVGRDV